MNNLPYKITDDLQITACKPVSKFRFRITFIALNRIQGEALYGWGNNQYTTLGVNAAITDTNDNTDIDTIDELVKENSIAIGEFLREEEKHFESTQGN